MAAYHGESVPNTGARDAGFLDRAGDEIHPAMLAWVRSPAVRRPARLALRPRYRIRTRDQGESAPADLAGMAPGPVDGTARACYFPHTTYSGS